MEESLSRWGFGGTAIDNAAPAALCGISGLGDKRLACLALSLRGWRFTDETTPDALRQAVRSYWQAFCLSHRIGCEENRAVALEGLGQAAWHTAEAADADKNHAFAALRLWGAAEHLQQKSGIPLRLPPVLREKAKEFHARAYEQAGRTVYDAQHFIGSVLTVPEVTRLAESVCLPPLEVT